MEPRVTVLHEKHNGASVRVECPEDNCGFVVYSWVPRGESPTGLLSNHMTNHLRAVPVRNLAVSWKVDATCTVCPDGGNICVVYAVDELHCCVCGTMMDGKEYAVRDGLFHTKSVDTIEDAQKLAVDTIAYRDSIEGRDIAVKRDDSLWQVLGGETYSDLDIIGWTSLVYVYDGFLL